MRPLALLAAAVFLGRCAFPHPGIGIVADPQGNVFYTDLKQVWRMSPDGTVTIAVPNVHTHELCLDSSGNLYGEHLWYEGDRTRKWGHFVWKRSPGGTIERVIPPTTGFLTNYSFVRDKAGNMYWADRNPSITRLRRRSADSIETIAEFPFRDVRWMAVSAAGVLYVIDYQDLIRVPPGGKPHVLARGLARNSRWMLLPNNHAVMGLSPDSHGNVYLAVMADGEVKKVSAAGDVTTAWKSPAPWSPAGVFAGTKDDVWVLETSPSLGVRVQKLPIKPPLSPAMSK